ncbi:hypothetical protein FZC80_09525 [Rossellomorea aquimaris]|uniref:Uncharacterized protein n=1 Tax=Rossellomorea aquimaris TaxID=189382 RepID=A0A5D4TY77_9BACI|nr:hypothetical protein FZC80_09525 [Rossellomorea aquimaris]
MKWFFREKISAEVSLCYKKSASAPFSPDRQMFPGEKKAVYPFILRGLFDPEGLGAGAGFRNAA